jgi:hypothetical protein
VKRGKFEIGGRRRRLWRWSGPSSSTMMLTERDKFAEIVIDDDGWKRRERGRRREIRGDGSGKEGNYKY